MTTMDALVADLLATLVALAIGALIVLRTGMGRRWVEWNRQQLPARMSPAGAAGATAVGAAVAFAVLHLLRYGSAFNVSFFVNAVVATVGVAGILYVAMREE